MRRAYRQVTGGGKKFTSKCGTRCGTKYGIKSETVSVIVREIGGDVALAASSVHDFYVAETFCSAAIFRTCRDARGMDPSRKYD